jgi:hypothetical protein
MRGPAKQNIMNDTTIAPATEAHNSNNSNTLPKYTTNIPAPSPVPFIDRLKAGEATLHSLVIGYLFVFGPSERPGYWQTHCRCCPAHTHSEFSTEELLSTKVSTCGCKNAANKDFAEYNQWKQARSRCLTQSNKDYPRYGGIGIAFEPRWDSFAQFFQDLGPKFAPYASLERDSHGTANAPNYALETCYWATPRQQAATRSKPGTRKAASPSSTIDLSAYGNYTAQQEQDKKLENALWCLDQIAKLKADREQLEAQGQFHIVDNAETYKMWNKWHDVYRDSVKSWVRDLDKAHRAKYQERLDREAEQENLKAEEQAAKRREEMVAAMTDEDREAFLAAEDFDCIEKSREEWRQKMTWEDFMIEEQLLRYAESPEETSSEETGEWMP